MEMTDTPPRPTHCTCGTLLAADARFCHRCGRPVFEEKHLAPEDAPVTATADSAAEDFKEASQPLPAIQIEGPAYEGPPEPIDLRNRMVVRLAFFTAAMLFPLVLLPIPLFPFPFLMKSMLLLGGGYFAVWLYQRRTQSRLGYLNAFRLGWISGLMLFLLVLAVWALMFAVLSLSGTNIMSQLTEAMQASEASNLSEEQLALMREAFSDWKRLFVVLLVSLFLVFLYCTALTGVGGALAARMPRGGSRAN